jgi:hypothetical protein
MPRDPLPPDPGCPRSLAPASDADYGALRTLVEDGPFFDAVRRHTDRPLRCAARLDDGVIVLAYETSDGARVSLRRDSSIELTEQRLVLPGLGRDEAVTMLRAVEARTFAPHGCGIDWSRPEVGSEPDGEAIVYRGEVCNCSATIVLRPDHRNESAFESTC